MKAYHDLLKHILQHGREKTDRTGVGTLSTFDYTLRFDLSEGLPVITTKKIHLKSVIEELLWFLRGDTNSRTLEEKGVTIWKEWARENGDLGPVYGAQWRAWPTCDDEGWYIIDQITNLLNDLKVNPDSRRMIVSAWNVGDLDRMALPPCHLLWQCYTEVMTYTERFEVARQQLSWDGLNALLKRIPASHLMDEMTWLGIPDRRLSLKITQRSCDAYLGAPFNITSYAILIHILAKLTNMIPGDLIWSGGDCHLYLNHLDQARLQLTREPRPLPTLTLIDRNQADPADFVYEDFVITGYDPHPHIFAPVAV